MDHSVRAVKRCFDVCGSLAGLVIAFPFFGAIAAAIRLEGPGPIFYRQRRAGTLRRRVGSQFEYDTFEIIKFRTMVVDAEADTGAVLSSAGDARVTRVGRFLRQFRLDELPQLINVLRGQMSIVGPRPERPELLEVIVSAVPYYEERTRGVKPGITGPAQISLDYMGGGLPGTDAERLQRGMSNPFGLEGAEDADADRLRMKLLYDLAYVMALDDWGAFLALEIRTLIKTPLVMLRAIGR